MSLLRGERSCREEKGALEGWEREREGAREFRQQTRVKGQCDVKIVTSLLPGNSSTVKDTLATLEPSVRKRVKTVGAKIGSAKTTPNCLQGERAQQHIM